MKRKCIFFKTMKYGKEISYTQYGRKEGTFFLSTTLLRKVSDFFHDSVGRSPRLFHCEEDSLIGYRLLVVRLKSISNNNNNSHNVEPTNGSYRND